MSNGFSSTAAVEEVVRVKEQAILDLGSLLSRGGQGQDLATLIARIRPFLSLVSKATASSAPDRVTAVVMKKEVELRSPPHAPHHRRFDG